MTNLVSAGDICRPYWTCSLMSLLFLIIRKSSLMLRGNVIDGATGY
jgi:hypothetical protein